MAWRNIKRAAYSPKVASGDEEETAIPRPDPRSRQRPVETHRINARIRVPEVRVVGPEGEQLGVMSSSQALERAREAGLDLVEVAARAVPPVCRIMDFGKFKFEEAKQKREARKRQSTIQVKEVKFRPKTDDHDLEFKLRNVRRFLLEGNKVRLIVQFRGREIVHPQTGRAVLDRAMQALAEVAHLEQMPRQEGRFLSMTIAPKPGLKREASPPPPPAPAPSEP